MKCVCNNGDMIPFYKLPDGWIRLKCDLCGDEIDMEEKWVHKLIGGIEG